MRHEFNSSFSERVPGVRPFRASVSLTLKIHMQYMLCLARRTIKKQTLLELQVDRLIFHVDLLYRYQETKFSRNYYRFIFLEQLFFKSAEPSVGNEVVLGLAKRKTPFKDEDIYTPPCGNGSAYTKAKGPYIIKYCTCSIAEQVLQKPIS
jgi:hypothetical protein